jgi:hypothetical protein
MQFLQKCLNVGGLAGFGHAMVKTDLVRLGEAGSSFSDEVMRLDASHIRMTRITMSSL